MKLEKRKNYLASPIQWGFLPALPNAESFLLTSPVWVAGDFQNPSTIFSKLANPSKIPHATLTLGDNFQGYNEEAAHIFDKYTIFRHSSFIDFFEKSRIDVPKCFKSTKSLRRPTFELFFLRLSNYLMRDGKKEKIFVSTNQAFTAFFLSLKKSSSYSANLQFTDWIFLYFALNNVSFTKTRYMNFLFNQYGNTFNQHFIKAGLKYHVQTSSLFSIIGALLSTVRPLFHFSLFGLDKRARKSGRKKTSKYIFIWKYVPLYRRKALLLKLIAGDVKFQAGRTLVERLLTSIDTLHNSPYKSHIIQTNRFAHQYVFKNLRRSLLSNFKMTA